jgi:hypothetical protein
MAAVTAFVKDFREIEMLDEKGQSLEEFLAHVRLLVHPPV